MFHIPRLDSLRTQYNEQIYLVFRVMVGVLFAFHGAQKLLGLFTDRAASPLMSLMGVAGVIELVGGFMLAFGLFTSYVALISAVEMVFAFFMSHFTVANPWPILNRGELALLYFACFLFIIVIGGGKYSLDKIIKK